MNKKYLAMKVLKSPRGRRLAVRALKNEYVRRLVVRRFARRLFSR